MVEAENVVAVHLYDWKTYDDAAQNHPGTNILDCVNNCLAGFSLCEPMDGMVLYAFKYQCVAKHSIAARHTFVGHARGGREHKRRRNIRANRLHKYRMEHRFILGIIGIISARR